MKSKARTVSTEAAELDQNPIAPAPPLEARTIRHSFARSLCSAHHMATLSERETCDDGVPCTKLGDCSDMADKTLAYLQYRNRLPKED
ncbi:MAG: hypothetical protein KAI73_03270 [Rhodospirillaceae bacterium]|nr:hypothetical protein [Rhodospirillaceae bacterium]